MAGKVVLVDFWASWCAPCKSSFPVLDSIYRKFKERGFLVVAVSVDESGDAMREFLGTHPVSFPVVRDARQQLVASAGIEAMPTSFLIDRTGKVVAVHAGFKGRETEEQLMTEIEKLLGASSVKKP